MLNPDEALGQQYLKAYLSGRRNLATDMGDMYSVIYSDSVSRQKYTKGFAELLSENIDYAPCLSAYGYEKSRAELIEALSQFGMIDADTLIFHAPEAVWDVRGFSTAAEVAGFFTELDTAASGLQLPEYLAGIFEGYRGELKDYFAIRAASAFFGEFSGDLGPFNKEIRLVANSMSSMGALTGILQKSSDQSVKLLALAVSGDVSDELREEAEFRLIETAGFDLANDALDSDGFSDAGAEWNELFDNYISAVRTGLGQEDGIEDYRSAMIARAAELWELSLALADPDSVDPDSAPEQWLESYSAMIWNSLDFDEALDRITGTDSTISISLLEQLRIIDQLMPETSGDFPSDVELEWLYGGNEVLREVDSMIVLGLPELWVGDSFDIAETVKSRYYSDEDISVMEGMLVLTIEESEAGVTTVDKAVQLWNDQFDGGLADGSIDGLLKAFYGLGLINPAVEAAGEYSAEYEYEDLLAELLDGAVLSEDNLALLEDAVLNPAEALEARLDKLAELDTEGLSGEELYWNLAWNLRSDAAEDDYSRTAARGARIFDDIEAAGVISNWISSFDEANFESYSEKLADLFDSQMSKIAGLAQSPAGGVYASIAACGIGEVLVEQAGYSVAAAADFVNWFLTKKGIDAAFDPGSLADYLSLEPDARFYSVLADYPDAASHYLKKQIAEGAFTSTTLSVLLDSVNLADETEAELVEIQGILDDVEVYNELLHGDFEDFLDDRYGSEEQKRTAREIYMRFMGSTKIQWDDSVFMLSSDCGAGAREILDNLSFNRTRGSNLSGLNPGSGTGSNEVFFSEALMTIYEKLYEGDDALTAELSALQSERDLQVRATDYLGSLETIDSDNWRSFLNDEYLSSEDDELNLVPASTVDYNYSDYTRNLQINNNDGDPVFQNFDSLTLFSGTGNDQLNIILDAANSYLDYAAYLTAAINSWDDGTISATETMRTLHEGLGSADGSDFRNSLESKSYAEINQAYLYEIDASVENGYKEARSEFYNLTAKIESIKESLSNFGYRRARLVRMAAMGSSEQLAELQPLNDEISALEADIDAAQAEWQELIDGADGYRMLEEEYAGVYAQTKAAMEELDVLKQEYSTARAIYEYASAGYLSIDDEILSEFDPVETDAEDDSTAPEDDETEVESGITGGTIVASDVDVDEQTADQAYRDALLATINKVSPAERLAYINEKLARAEAANDALETIINGGSVTESIYSKDEVYRAYFDNYLETFRESLVLNKINLVLNKAIARQETVTREALSDWNTAIGESYGTPGYLDSEGNAIVPFGLDLCTIIQNADGSRDISWDGAGSNAETFRQYFEANEDSETGLSDFQNDLMLWLEKVSGIMNGSGAQDLFTTWAMALKWEEFQAAGAPGDINDNFWNDFLNKNGEGDLDREGAKSLLITEWQNAFNKVNSCTGENKQLYNFYKLLDKGGIMQLNTDTTSGDSFETFDLLGKNESVVLANQYMSNEYNQDAKNFFIASIPMFSMAVAYFAAATLALAIPFNWIAAIILFALGTAAALGGAHMVGEGNAKKAAADYIQNKIVKPAEYNSKKFMLNFKQNTSLILEKKQVYEEEFAKFQRMKGEAAGDETLTDEKRIELMRISTIEAFANEGEDLHSLLFQGGLVSETENNAADTAALEALFGDYQEKMDQSEKDESVNSSLFISALEEESQDYKQITARELNDYLTGEDGVAREQAEAEEAYRSAYYQYLAEEISLEEFEEAAESAFGNPAFSVREHMLRLYEQQAGIAEIIMGSDQFNAAISAELLESQELLLYGSGSRKGIYDYKMSNYREVRMYGLQMLQLEMNEKYRNWENQMRAISARGELEWSAGERKLTRKYTEWQKETKRLYNRQSEAWDDKYLDFLSDKQAWLDAVMIQSTKVGDMDVLENFGEMTGAAIAAAGADVLVGDFSSLDVDPDTLLSEVVDFELLGTLLENAQSLNDSINDTENVIFTAAEPDRFTTADSLQAIKDFQSVQNEEYEKHLAELELERMLEQVEDAEESFNESIGSANKSLDSNINQTMRNDGYTRSGGRYERELVVGATIGGYVYEDGYVSTYDDYLPENIDFGSELKDAGNNVENLDSKGLQGLVARALENIQEQLERIFGSDDETENAEMLAELGFPVNVEKEKYTIDREDQSIYEGPGVLESVANWVGDIFNIPEDPEKAKGEAAAAEKRFAEISPGLFGIHVGYSPEFADNADTGKEWDDEGQIKYEGLGEMGRIMGEFIFNKMKEGAGWAEVNMPHYKKPLWEGEIFGIEAPSAADLTSLAVTICTAGAASGAGAILSATINLSDDFALSAMDIATGDKSLLEGTLDFGKKAFVSLAGAGFSEAGDALSSTMDLDWGGELLLNVGEQIVTNTYSGAINAIEYSEEGGWNYNWNTLEQSVAGESAVAGYIGSAVGTAATEAFGSLLSGSLTPIEMSYYESLADLGGVALQQTSEYAVHLGYQLAEDGFGDMGGSMSTAFDDMGMSLNVLDIGSVLELAGILGAGFSDNSSSDFLMNLDSVAENLKGTGLLALNINSQGVTGKITSGGVNVGSHLYNLGKGFTADMAFRAYKADEKQGSEILETGYLHGDQAYENTIWRVLFGKDDLVFDKTTGEAKTEKEGTGRTIYMNSKYKDAQGEEFLKGVTVLQHESYRDGVTDDMNDVETMRAVKAHTEIALALGNAYGFSFIAGDQNLLADVAAYMAAKGGSNSFNTEAFKNYVDGNYDSSADYWKLTADGNVMFDGKKDMYDEDGKLLREYEGTGNGGYAASLAEHLGISPEEANQMMKDAGWTYSDGTFTTEGGKINVLNDANYILDPGANFAARYFMQRDYVDKVGEYGGSMVLAAEAAREELTLKYAAAMQTGTVTPELIEQYNMLSELDTLAIAYDTALYGTSYGSFSVPGLLNQERNERYSQADITEAFQQIRDGWSLTNDNPMYSLIGDGKLLDPIQGGDLISTWSHYEDGSMHGWQGGAAIDLATMYGENYPVFTTQEETLLVGTNPLGWDNSSNENAGYGYNLQTYTDNFNMIYGHLQSDTFASNQLNSLVLTAQEMDFYRFSLPPGYQFGNVGNTGHSTGTHLHWEYRPLW